MKRVRTALLATCIVALMIVAVSPALAAGGNTITATVEPKVISCTVGTTVYDFGTLALGDTAQSSPIVVSNDGNVTESIYVKTSHALNLPATGVWHATGQGTDAYGLAWDDIPSITGPFQVLEADTLLASLAADADKTIDMWLLMPTASTQTGTYQFTITFTATE